MRRIGYGLFLLWLCVGTVRGQQPPAVYRGQQEKLPVAVAPQPIAFSHKKHFAMRQTCVDCHAGATGEEEPGLPKTDLCMACHETIKTRSREIKKLAAARQRGERLNWVRVYRLPDFVFFSHANHTKAGLKCQECHGPVEKRDVLAKEVSTSMVACMNCHAVKKAPMGCSACHQLGQ
jgi:predicted CXXCH cytochrome family protein